ncbi:MAG: hypothetical protein Q7S16_02495 [bacterium]|nr:hypothetical protein [bacterium]
MMQATTIQITLPTTRTKARRLIAVDAVEWESMQKHVSELERALKVIAHGDQEFRQGKTRLVASLRELAR